MQSASKCSNLAGMSSIASNAEKLNYHLQQLLSDEKRIVINGASGWLGSNITETLSQIYGSNLSEYVLLTASSSKSLRLRNNAEIEVHKWNKRQVMKFAPTHVLQLAFKTRDHVKKLSLNDYSRLNMEIIESANWMITLPSVKGFMHTSSGAVCGPSTHSLEIDPYGYLKSIEELEFARTCADFDTNYLGVRVWSTSGAYIKTGGLLAIESLITQALTGNSIKIESDCRTYRTYVDANEFLVASLIGLLKGKTGLYNSGGDEIEIGALASVISNLTSGSYHQIIRPEFSSEMENRFCSQNPSIEDVLLELDLKFSSIPSQVVQTMEYIKEVS